MKTDERVDAQSFLTEVMESHGTTVHIDENSTWFEMPVCVIQLLGISSGQLSEDVRFDSDAHSLYFHRYGEDYQLVRFMLDQILAITPPPTMIIDHGEAIDFSGLQALPGRHGTVH